MTLTRKPHSLVVLTLLALTGGCFYPADRGRLVETRLEKLEADKRGLEESLASQKKLLDAQLPRLDQQFERVQQALATLEKATRSSGADVVVQLDTLKNELATLRGAIDQQANKTSELEAALGEGRSGTSGTTGPSTSGSELTQTVQKTPDAPPRTLDKKEQLELVEQRLSQAPVEGRKLAGEWLRKYPKDPLAARAYYALGTSQMASKDYRAALSEFGEIVKNFSRSEQAPAALLKSSDCFAALKMKAESQIALEEIINSYPKSDAAKTAQTRLADLKKGGKKK